MIDLDECEAHAIVLRDQCKWGSPRETVVGLAIVVIELIGMIRANKLEADAMLAAREPKPAPDAGTPPEFRD